jgi:phage shock protein C
MPPPPSPPVLRPLQRGADRRIAGVCSGLAEYLGIDTWLVRLIFLVLLFVGGAGLLIYIVLWIVMPDPYRRVPISGAPTVWPDDETRRHRSAIAVGVVLGVAGVLLLLGNLGLLYWVEWKYIWPVALILLGVLLIARRR